MGRGIGGGGGVQSAGSYWAVGWEGEFGWLKDEEGWVGRGKELLGGWKKERILAERRNKKKQRNVKE